MTWLNFMHQTLLGTTEASEPPKKIIYLLILGLNWYK